MDKELHDIEETLIAKYLMGEATPDEERTLSAWIAANDSNRIHFEKTKAALEISVKHKPVAQEPLNIDVDQEWNRFLENANQSDNVLRMPTGSNWLRIAAAILLLVASGVLINYFINSGSDFVYQTAENTQLVTLPDNSQVVLNRNSVLTFADSFLEQERRVSLRGEAFFEVQKDPTKPFVIECDGAEVVVVGTSFNVDNSNFQGTLEVVVSSGKVKIASMKGKDEILLEAGDKGVFDRVSGRLNEQKNDDANFMSWKTKKLEFDGSSLIDVVTALSDTYGVDISVAVEVPASCLVTATFDNQDLDAVLKILQSTLGLTYKRTKGQIEITEVEC